MSATAATNGSSAGLLGTQPDSVYGEVALNVIKAERDGSITFPA